jgi:hypothetical protein
MENNQIDYKAEYENLSEILDQMETPKYAKSGIKYTLWGRVSTITDNLKNAESRINNLEAALAEISTGDGVYGKQAGEYKAIARKALAAKVK